MSNERIIAEVVRTWVAQVLPDEPGVAETAAFVAANAYAAGGTVGDACLGARNFVRSWAEHPSNQRLNPRLGLPVAS